MNLDTITDTQSRYKVWQLNGFNHVRAKQKFHSKRKGVCRSSWRRRKSRKAFVLTIPWNSVKTVKHYFGIIARQHIIILRRMALVKERCARMFLEPSEKLKVIYTDNSLEFSRAFEELSWNHCISTPHRSVTSGTAERAVRRIQEGTFAVLLESGLDEKW